MMTRPYTVFLNGSPHPRGKSMTLARIVADALPGAKQTINLYEQGIHPCRDCDDCGDGASCEYEADAMREVMAEVARADFLILVSPLHFSSLTAPLVAFVSRLQPAWRGLHKYGKSYLPPQRRLGALLVTAGSRYPDMFRPARSVALAAFNSLSIPFAGMAAAADTDTVPVQDNEAAVAEAGKLAECLLSGLHL